MFYLQRKRENEMICATTILQAQLARGLGLDKYAEIMRGDPTDPDFQRLFNGYYRIRRNEEWRKHFYSLFAKVEADNVTFEYILRELYKLTGNVEASFSSKMLATVDASKPVWDKYVLQNLGLKLSGKTQAEKLNSAVALYRSIETWYSEYMSTSEARENIETFNCMLPDFAWISDVKKIDFLLWSMRE